ncbi:MAG: alpha/beta fold hydrolase, partial [Microthrixaceae bacterium]
DVPVVRTAYEEHGRGPGTTPVVLLHGGVVGGAGTWSAQVPALAARHHVFVPDRRGHGRTPDVPGPYSYESLATETERFLDEVVREPAHLVGFSDGGNIALHVARRRPELVRSLVLIGANFHHRGLHPEFTAAARGETDAVPWAVPRGPDPRASSEVAASWRSVADKLVRLWSEGPSMSTGDLAQVTAPTLVVVGDDDCIDHHHTIELYESLPDAQLAVVPGTSHLCLAEKPRLVNLLVVQFLEDQRPHRTLPLRGAVAPPTSADAQSG